MPEWFSHHPMTSGVLAALVTCLPSLIMAAKDRPKTRTVLTRLLKLLSWLQPKNSYGTLKVPGKEPAPAVPEFIDMDPPNLDNTDPSDIDTAPGIIKSPPATILALGFLALFLSACCTGPRCQMAKEAILDCTTAAMKDQITSLFPQVYTALAGDGMQADWKYELGQLEAGFGTAVVCTVGSILRDFETAPRGAAMPPEAGPITANGHEYLTSKGNPQIKL